MYHGLDFPFTVDAVRLMDLGACSYAQDLAGLHEFVWTQFWSTFMSQVGGSAVRDYLDVISYLDHAPGIPLDVRGGFFLDFAFRVSAGPSQVHMCFDANYEYAVEDGILGVAPSVNSGLVYGPAAADPNAITDQMSTALHDTLPIEFRAAALDLQTRDITGWLCTLGQLHDCDTPAAAFTDELRGKALDLGFTVPETDTMAATVNSPVPEGTVLPDATYTALRQWRCVPAEGSAEGKGTCQFVTRAKRVNVYPDQVELVWFDDKELDNPTYALWVASHGDAAGGGDRTGELCTWQAGPQPQATYERLPDYTRAGPGNGTTP